MLRTIAQQLDMSLSQLKEHLAYKYGVNEEGFYNGLSCFETLPEFVQASLLNEVGLTEDEVELKEKQNDENDENDEDDQDEDDQDEDTGSTDRNSQVVAQLKLDPTPPPAAVTAPATAPAPATKSSK